MGLKPEISLKNQRIALCVGRFGPTRERPEERGENQGKKTPTGYKWSLKTGVGPFLPKPGGLWCQWPFAFNFCGNKQFLAVIFLCFLIPFKDWIENIMLNFRSKIFWHELTRFQWINGFNFNLTNEQDPWWRKYWTFPLLNLIARAPWVILNCCTLSFQLSPLFAFAFLSKRKRNEAAWKEIMNEIPYFLTLESSNGRKEHPISGKEKQRD